MFNRKRRPEGGCQSGRMYEEARHRWTAPLTVDAGVLPPDGTTQLAVTRRNIERLL
jgi:hypothetical protein